MHDDILSGFIVVVVKTQFLFDVINVQLKLQFKRKQMKPRIFSKTIISTSIDLSYSCNSVSNDCGIFGFDLDNVSCYSELLNYWMWEATEKAHNFFKKGHLVCNGNANRHNTN